MRLHVSLIIVIFVGHYGEVMITDEMDADRVNAIEGHFRPITRAPASP